MKRSISLLIFSYLFITNLQAVEAVSLSSVVGKKYKVFIYAPNAKTSESTLTFHEDAYLEFSAFEGFGLYSTLEGFFIGSYWAPDYYEQNDLIIIFSGLTFDPYILITGFLLVNINISTLTPWFCVGHAQ